LILWLFSYKLFWDFVSKFVACVCLFWQCAVTVTVCSATYRQHLSCDDCAEVRTENNQNCFVLCCVWQLCTMICTHMWMWTVVEFACCLGLDFTFVCFFSFALCVCVFYVSWDHFIPVLLVFCCVGFSFFGSVTKPRDWLGRMYPKWPILCQVGRTTLIQSINQSMWLLRLRTRLVCVCVFVMQVCF